MKATMNKNSEYVKSWKETIAPCVNSADIALERLMKATKTVSRDNRKSDHGSKPATAAHIVATLPHVVLNFLVLTPVS
jgi:hypothetical protein